MTAAVSAPSAPDSLGVMPEWDLRDLYPAPDSPELEKDIAWLDQQASAFQQRFDGKLATLSGAELAEAIRTYEQMTEVMWRVLGYASLRYAADLSNPEHGRFYQSLQERVNPISSKTLFFTLDLNKVDDARLSEQLADPALAHYAPWLRELRCFRPYQLSADIEQILHEREVVGTSAWCRLFDETMADLRFDVDGETLTSAQTLNLMSGKDPAKRRSAAKAFGAVLGQNNRLLSMIYNTLIKDKEIDDKSRGYATATTYRNMSNQVEDAVVDALVSAVKASYGQISHRYYQLKAKWLGVEQMDYWDRNAPLPEADDRTIPWSEACDIVLGAYHRFSPELGAVADKFFGESKWIDAPARPGKSPGAFAHPMVESAHPYLLLNYLGKTRDVMTLAHELGHGCHQYLSYSQGTLMASTPLTLAETASVFGEMLTFRALLDGETDPVRRKVMLASKVEDMINTVVRQTAFFEFEKAMHQERRNGEVAAERIGEIWMQIQTESLGPAFRYDDEYQYFWSYIQHFIHSPFYVYAYAFGDCLVNALYDVWRSGATPDFEGKYLEMLKTGGRLRHQELLAPFGLDATDPAFWQRGLNILIGLIDELEQMA